MAVQRARRRPSETNEIEICGRNTGKIEAGLNGALGKSRIVLGAAQPFFGHGIVIT